MDKRRNHIIFWVGYVLIYNLVFFYTVLNDEERKSLSVFLEFNTNSIAHIFIFYYLILKIFPETLTLKKYRLSILYTLLLLSFTTLTLLSVRESILHDGHFKTYKNFIKSFTDILNNTQIALFLASVYWFSKQYINDEIRKNKVAFKKHTLIKENLQAELLELKGQINPHFLYNTLNLFYAQSIPYSKKLSDGIMSFSEIMRYTIDRNEDFKVPLENEIKHLKNYFKLYSITSPKEVNIDFVVNGNLSYSRITPSILLQLIDTIIPQISEQSLQVMLNINKNLFSLLIKINEIGTVSFDFKNVYLKLDQFYFNQYTIEVFSDTDYTLLLKIEL